MRMGTLSSQGSGALRRSLGVRSSGLIWSKSSRCISFGSLFGRKGEGKEKVEDQDILEDGLQTAIEARDSSKVTLWGHLSEDQVLAIRDKSRLPDEVRREVAGIPNQRLTLMKHYEKNWIKSYYAKFGRVSGVKPGVCWPSKEEAEFMVKFEEKFYPSLSDLMAENKRTKEVAQKEKRDHQKDVLEKLKKWPQMRKEFMGKFDQKKKEEAAAKVKKEKLVQEVREFLGYDIDPRDLRFQEALLKKEEEEKALAKISKKQERQAKVMASLAAMAEEGQKELKEAEKSAKAAADDKEPEKQMQDSRVSGQERQPKVKGKAKGGEEGKGNKTSEEVK